MLDHGKKWATDVPLRKNMTEIRAALAASEAGIHKGTLTPDDYKALGALVEAPVATIVAECNTRARGRREPLPGRCRPRRQRRRDARQVENNAGCRSGASGACRERAWTLFQPSRLETVGLMRPSAGIEGKLGGSKEMK